MDPAERITWGQTPHQQFEKILEQIPPMIRGIAEARVSKKAQNIVKEDGRRIIEEKDMVTAFFAETPAGFIPTMKASLDELEIDYTQYGYE